MNDGAPKRPQPDRRATTEPRFGTPLSRVIELLKRVSQVRILLAMKAAAFGIGIYNTVVALAALETWSWAAAL
ncbi:hypothetical protein ACFVRU_00910, partial [Streptomyces sp. NPDC057927]